MYASALMSIPIVIDGEIYTYPTICSCKIHIHTYFLAFFYEDFFGEPCGPLHTNRKFKMLILTALLPLMAIKMSAFENARHSEPIDEDNIIRLIEYKNDGNF